MRLGDGQEYTAVLTLPRPTLKYDIPYNTKSKHVIFRRKMRDYKARRANSKKKTVACANDHPNFARVLFMQQTDISKWKIQQVWTNSLTNQTCLSTNNESSLIAIPWKTSANELLNSVLIDRGWKWILSDLSLNFHVTIVHGLEKGRVLPT